MADNIYRIDDALIRAGYIFGIVAVFASFNLPGTAIFGLPALTWITLSLLVVAPVVMLIAGYAVRRREHRLLEIWKLLKKHGEVPVDDVLQMSGYSRSELREAVALLNRKIAAGLSFDESSNTIRHLRLGRQESLTHSQRCDSCGASVSIDVSAHNDPARMRCPYCHGALDSQAISRLQNELLSRAAQIRNPQPDAVFFKTPVDQPRPTGKRFNLVFFIILLMFFWPAALIYAINRANRSQTF